MNEKEESKTGSSKPLPRTASVRARRAFVYAFRCHGYPSRLRYRTLDRDPAESTWHEVPEEFLSGKPIPPSDT